MTWALIKWQEEFRGLLRDFREQTLPARINVNGEMKHGIVIHAVTGGGKGRTSAIVAEECPEIEQILHVVPTSPLVEQQVKDFGASKYLRRDKDPFNDGEHRVVVTTYQKLSQSVGPPSVIDKAFKKRKSAIVLDEFHHVAEGGEYHKALLVAMKRAALVILPSGTLERNHSGRIAFLNYEKSTDHSWVIPHDDGYMLRYTRKQALIEKRIILLKFFQPGGKVKYTSNETVYEHDLSAPPKGEERRSLAVALQSDIAEAIFVEGMKDWLEQRGRGRRGKLLIVCPDQNTTDGFSAYAIKRRLETKEYGEKVALAISDEGSAAEDAVKGFKGAIDICVTCAMCYEGLDVPEITHMIFLSRFRTRPWIEQAFGRAIRRCDKIAPYNNQLAKIFLPDDVMINEIIEKIKIEQDAVLRERGGDGPPPPTGDGSLFPIGSKHTSTRVTLLDEEYDDPSRGVAAIAAEEDIPEDIVRRVQDRERELLFREIAECDSVKAGSSDVQFNARKASRRLQDLTSLVDAEERKEKGSTNGWLKSRLGVRDDWKQEQYLEADRLIRIAYRRHYENFNARRIRESERAAGIA